MVPSIIELVILRSGGLLLCQKTQPSSSVTLKVNESHVLSTQEAVAVIPSMAARGKETVPQAEQKAAFCSVTRCDSHMVSTHRVPTLSLVLGTGAGLVRKLSFVDVPVPTPVHISLTPRTRMVEGNQHPQAVHWPPLECHGMHIQA